MKRSALELIQQEKELKTGRLNLGGCALEEFPKELFELTWLEILIVSEGYRERAEASFVGWK